MVLHDCDTSQNPGFRDTSRARPVRRRFDHLPPAYRGREGRPSMPIPFDRPIGRLHLQPLQGPTA
jgi:hypothetical protein